MSSNVKNSRCHKVTLYSLPSSVLEAKKVQQSRRRTDEETIIEGVKGHSQSYRPSMSGEIPVGTVSLAHLRWAVFSRVFGLF